MPEEVKESKNFINLGVVRNGSGEVLMIRRTKKESKGGVTLEWAFPGGKQAYEETRADCVKKEVLSETGYDVIPEKEISMRVHPQWLITMVYHLCRLNSPQPIAEVKDTHEVAEVRWIKLEDIRDLITTDLDEKVAKVLGI